jgi:multiple sugar transport system substrate-binding protein
MLRRHLFAAGLALAVASASAADAQTITFRFNDPEAPQMRAALDEFEKRNPGIKVTMQRTSWGDAQQQFLREAAVGTAPDVAQVAFVWPRAFGGAGALRPLDDLIARPGLGIKGWDDFFARDLAVGADGKAYGVPWTTDTFAMIWNKDLFAAAGIAEFPRTWESLRAASQAIHQKTGKTGWGFPAGSCGTPTIWFVLNFYWWSKGPGLIDRMPDGKYRVSMTPAEIQDGFDYYNRYLKEGHNPRSQPDLLPVGRARDRRGHAVGQHGRRQRPRHRRDRDQHEVEAAQSRQAVAIRHVAASRRPERLADLLRRPHAGDQRQLQARRGELEADPVPDPARSDLHEALHQLHAGAARGARRARLGPELAGYPEQLKTARSWGPYGTGPVAIPFMWNAVGRAAGSVFIGEKTSAQAAAELHDAISKRTREEPEVRSNRPTCARGRSTR